MPRLATQAMLVLAVSAPVAAQKPTAERPTLQVGQGWILDAGEFTLATVARDHYAFTAGGGHEIHLSLDLVPIRIVREGRNIWEMDPAPAIRWPLEVGRWGTSPAGVLKESRELPLSVSNLSSKNMRATWRVQAHEPLLVAGTRLNTFRSPSSSTPGTGPSTGGEEVALGGQPPAPGHEGRDGGPAAPDQARPSGTLTNRGRRARPGSSRGRL